MVVMRRVQRVVVEVIEEAVEPGSGGASAQIEKALERVRSAEELCEGGSWIAVEGVEGGSGGMSASADSSIAAATASASSAYTE